MFLPKVDAHNQNQIYIKQSTTPSMGRPNFSQQYSRNQKGGGFVVQTSQGFHRGSQVEQISRQFQPLVKQVQYAKSFSLLCQAYDVGGTQESLQITTTNEAMLKDNKRLNYQGLSQVKHTDNQKDIKTSKFIFSQMNYNRHSSFGVSEPSTEGSMFQTKIWNKFPTQVEQDNKFMTNTTTEKFSENYQKDINMLNQEQKQKHINRKMKQIFSTFKIKDPLLYQEFAIRSVTKANDLIQLQKIHDKKAECDEIKYADIKDPLRKYILGDSQRSLRKILLINSLYFKTCSSRNSLQPLYVNIQQQKLHAVVSQAGAIDLFLEFVQAVKNSLKINSIKLFFYLKNGSPVYSYLDIPIDQCTLVYSSSPVYQGINYDDRCQKNILLLKIIHQLEQKCGKDMVFDDFVPNITSQVGKTISIEARFEQKYRPKINGIVEMLVQQDYVKMMQDENQELIECQVEKIFSAHDSVVDEEVDQEQYLNSQQLQSILKVFNNTKPQNKNKQMSRIIETTILPPSSQSVALSKIESKSTITINPKQNISQQFTLIGGRQRQLKEYMRSEQPVVLSQDQQKLDQLEQKYEEDMRQIDFTYELEGEINQIIMNKEDIDHDERNKHLDLASKYIATIFDKYLGKINKKFKITPEEEEYVSENDSIDSEIQIVPEMEINFNKQEDEGCQTGVDFIDFNKKALTTKRLQIKKLHRINKELFLQNIPHLLKKTNFNRYELHTTYILYTTLQQITSQRYQQYEPDDGIDYETFRNGIYQVFMQSEELARNIFSKIDFNYSGFLNWDEFLDLMVIIRAKTLKEKVDLFIKIADEDGNGLLSKNEIFNLSKVCLSRYIMTQSDGSNDFLDMLCEYFTRLIFDAVDVDIEDEIPMGLIKRAVLEGNSESDLLCMFCGADM